MIGRRFVEVGSATLRSFIATMAVSTVLSALGSHGEAQELTLVAARAVDGRGSAIANPVIVVRDGRILSVRSGPPPSGLRVIDLGSRTLLPGLIDAHVHITAHFGERDERPAMRSLQAAANARALLESGFTTVRSLGSPDYLDVDLRDAIAMGVVPGPRLLVSGDGMSDGSMPGVEGDRVKRGASAADEAAIRGWVRERAQGGVDWIKVFATRSSRQGGTAVYSQAQMDAVGDEARRAGLPLAVHAHSADGARRAILAGARTIEHGSMLDDATLDLMIERGTFYSPNLYLGEYYLANAERFGFSEDELDWTRRLLPPRREVFRRAVEKGVRIVFGTDANSGWLSSGTTAIEFERRVASGQTPGDAIVSATTRAAEALMLADSVGDLRPGLVADIIAVDGNPLTDIRALGRVEFVMKGGRIWRTPAR